MKKIVAFLLLAALALGALGCSATSRYYRLEGREFNQIDYGYPVEYAQVRNMKIGYIDQGSGDQTLLLIHGLGSNAKGWTRNIPELSKHYRVIAVDLPGYGYSSKNYYPYSLSWYGEVLMQFMDQLGIDKVVFVGHSMGGQIAILAALHYPERVSKLVLISPAGIEKFTEGEKDWFRKVAVPELTEDATTRTIDINLRSNFYNYPPEAAFMVTDRIQVKQASDFDQYAYAVAENIKGMVNEPTSDLLGEITQPTLIFFGKYDQLIPNRFLNAGFTEEIGKIADEKIPNSKLVMTETGHFIQFEDPETVDAAIEAFVQ